MDDQGIWNLIGGIATNESRLEILDWYHLVENLYKVGGDQALLARVEAFLWRGNVAAFLLPNLTGGHILK